MMRSVFLAGVALLAAPLPVLAQQTSPSRIAPPTRADQAAPQAPKAQAPLKRSNSQPKAPGVKPFVLRDVVVTGSSLSPAVLETIWRPFIGKTLDGPGIQTLSDAIAKPYETADIAIYSVLIPDQDLKDGVLRVKVLEGHVEKLDYDASKAGRAGPLIDRRAAKLTAQTPLAKSSLQRNISLIRDIPGLNTGMDLLNGGTDDGVIIKITPTFRPVQLGFAINNRGTYLLGKTQIQGDLYLNSLLRSGDQTRLTVALPTESGLFKFGALSHSTPLGGDGDVLMASASYLETKPKGTALVGHATSVGLQFTRPVVRAFDHDVYVTLGLDGVDANNALFGSAFSDDRSRAARLAVAYGQTKPNYAFAIVGSLSQGINGLGARSTTPAFTNLSFTKANLRANYSHTLGERGAIRLKASGQVTGSQLPGSEQFSLGGMDYGRAYETAIISGDQGIAGAVEGAYRPALFKAALSGSELYAFADAGRTTYRARGTLPTFSNNLGSIGAGVRLAIASKAVLEIEGARAARNSNAFLDNRGWRGVVSLKTLF